MKNFIQHLLTEYGDSRDDSPTEIRCLRDDLRDDAEDKDAAAQTRLEVHHHWRGASHQEREVQGEHENESF